MGVKWDRYVIRPIHPFPARMAPDVALTELSRLKTPSVVLDPMVGSGTVVRHASHLGHRAQGFDLDPLAVLMSTVWTTPVDQSHLRSFCHRALNEIKSIKSTVRLPWIDDDEEMCRFIEYWFAEPQRADLRRIAFVLAGLHESKRRGQSRAAINLLRLALSRIIITKNQGASLGRDISHSRPHKVAEESSFDVMAAYERSIGQIQQFLAKSPPVGNVDVNIGDARSLSSTENGSFDAILTSPPYLNAIDYMRGHKLSLVWLGYRLADLRQLRSSSIGAERSSKTSGAAQLFGEIQTSMCDVDKLSRRHAGMTLLYAEDVYRFVSEIARVLRLGGNAILVVGNSCLQGTFIHNSNGVEHAASAVGLKLSRKIERDLPAKHRYLPMPTSSEAPLGKRMRTETVLTFKHR
jgi:hypothetical protein